MCECIAAMDKHLAEHNSRVCTTFVRRGNRLEVQVALATEKLDRRNRAKMGAIATFCPFCGERYVAAEEAA